MVNKVAFLIFKFSFLIFASCGNPVMVKELARLIPGETGDPAPGEPTLAITVSPVSSLTPMNNGAYTEREASFTITVSGFIEDADAAAVNLVFSPLTVTGLPFFGESSGPNTSGGVKTFTIKVEYDGTTPFPSGAKDIDVSLSFIPEAYKHTGSKTLTLKIYDGQAAGGRAIPVNQGNIAHFNEYAKTANGLSKHYCLTENIIITEPGPNNWKRIGTASPSEPFNGSFDGRGNTIKNLSINSSSAEQGMFGCIGTNGSVKNLGLMEVSVKGTTSTGAVAAENNGTIENCFVTGAVTGTGGANSIGGVAGDNGGTVRNCYTTCNVNGKHYIGGIAGTISGGTVQNCYAAGIIKGDDWCGGIAGETLSGGLIQSCVGLNPKIINTSGTGTNFGRVAGVIFPGGNLNGNYGRDDMVVNGLAITGTPLHNSINGETVNDGFAGYKSITFYTSTVGWDFSNTGAWIWGSNNLPILRVFPENAQNHTVP